LLARTSAALKLVQRVRDEAHRFAISYHRRLRDRELMHSALDDIPGIGAKTRLALLRHFGSVARIATASAQDLAAVPGVGAVTAERILSVLSHPALRPGPDGTPGQAPSDDESSEEIVLDAEWMAADEPLPGGPA